MTPESTVSALSRPANVACPSKPRRKLCKQSSHWYRRMSPKVYIFSNSMSKLQHILNLHPSQQVANCDVSEILGARASLATRRCHLTFKWCHGHSGVCSNKLADVAAEEGITVEQGGDSHHYDSANAVIRQATKEAPITHEHLRHIYVKRGEKVKHKLESLQLLMTDQVPVSRLWGGHHPDLKYLFHKIGRVLDTVRRKCGMVEEIVEHIMGGVLESTNLQPNYPYPT